MSDPGPSADDGTPRRRAPRWVWLAAGLAASLALSAFFWFVLDMAAGFLFLLFPFFLFGNRSSRYAAPAPRPVCPVCGHRGAPADLYCPRDGTRLSHNG